MAFCLVAVLLTVDGTVTLDSTAYLHVNDAQNLQNGVFGTFLQATARVFRSSDSALIFR